MSVRAQIGGEGAVERVHHPVGSAKNVVSALQSGSNTIHGVLKTLGERPE